jgi:hypothetical protein
MRYLKMVVFALLPVVMLALVGCGGSGSTTQDPFGSKTPVNPPSNPVYPNISTATGKLTLSLTTDVPSIDVDNGQVLAIAQVKAGDAPVAGITVSFSATPNTLVTIESATAVTDSTGTAVTRITSGHVDSTTNVLLKAEIKVGTATVVTNANLQLVRGGGVIMFTDKAGQNPTGQTNLYPLTTKTAPEGGPYYYYTLIPFKVTDSNGNPRVGVPVTLSVYSITTKDANDATVDFLVGQVTEPNQATVTTDSAGQGVFNTRVFMTDYLFAKQHVVVDLVYKAVTNGSPPVTAYLGVPYELVGEEKATTTP